MDLEDWMQIICLSDANYFVQEHRSLKSSQILVSASGSSALIADAGLQALSQHSNHHWKDRFINNLNWGAPEFLTGKRSAAI